MLSPALQNLPLHIPCSHRLLEHYVSTYWKFSGRNQEKVELVPVFTLCFNMQDNTKVCEEATSGPFWYPYSLSYTREHPTFPLASPPVTLNSSCKNKDREKKRENLSTPFWVFSEKSQNLWWHLPSSEGKSHLGHGTIFPLEARCLKYQTAF